MRWSRKVLLLSPYHQRIVWFHVAGHWCCAIGASINEKPPRTRWRAVRGGLVLLDPSPACLARAGGDNQLAGLRLSTRTIENVSSLKKKLRPAIKVSAVPEQHR